VVSAHTLKPLDVEGVAKLLGRFDTVAVIEEATVRGGLGARVKEIAWECGARCALRLFGLQDEFIHHYGSHAELLAAHGLSAGQIFGGIVDKA
jgi:transketolase